MIETARIFTDNGGSLETGQTPTPTNVGVFPLTLCTTTDRLLAMLSVLYEGGAALGYGYLGDHNRDLINALAWLNDNNAPCAATEPTTEPTTEPIQAVIKQICAVFPDETRAALEEIEDEMTRPTYQKFNGLWYIGLPCGDCGGLEWVELGPGAAVDPATGSPGLAADMPPAWIEAVELSPENTACYADKVADIITNALTAYTDAVFNYAVFGAAAFTPVITAALIGAIEIQQVIAAAMRGDIALNFADAGYSASEVKAAIQGDDFRNFIKARLGDDQRVNRFTLELVQLRLNANFGLNTPTPIAPVFGAWIKTANIEALNVALQEAALACETGNQVQQQLGFSDEFIAASTGDTYILANTDWLGVAQPSIGATWERQFAIPANTEFVGILVGTRNFNEPAPCFGQGFVPVTFSYGGVEFIPGNTEQNVVGDNKYHYHKTLASEAPTIADLTTFNAAYAGIQTENQSGTAPGPGPVQVEITNNGCDGWSIEYALTLILRVLS